MDIRYSIGQAIRSLRKNRQMTQESLAEKSGISYQFLSGIENGKENFSINILDDLARSLGVPVTGLLSEKFDDYGEKLKLMHAEELIKQVILPHDLTVNHIKDALNEAQRVIHFVNKTVNSVSGRPLSQFIQRNNYSGIVSNIICDAFSRLTPYKHFHDQRYPDLMCKHQDGTQTGLEIKATINYGKGGESHNGHSGWHLVACYGLDEINGDIEFIHVMIAYLNGHNGHLPDWKYVGSQENTITGSRRTETYNTTLEGTSKLRYGTVVLSDKKRASFFTQRWRYSEHIPRPSYTPWS
ncbi:MAG: helix-turn-helix transcriptional regulator [Akkermansia sp.]